MAWRKVNQPKAKAYARMSGVDTGIDPMAMMPDEIPDEHIVTVEERRISVDYQTIIQDNMGTDVLILNLDGEWDGLSTVVYCGYTGDLKEYAWSGSPIKLPVYGSTGSLDLTVVGLSPDGKTRLVTAEAKGVLTVIRAGEHDGSVPSEDQPDLLGQILAAKGDAEDAADAANSAAADASEAAQEARDAAGAISENLQYYFGRDVVGDVSYLTLYEEEE